MKRIRTLTDHPMTTGYVEKQEFYNSLLEQKESLDKRRFIKVEMRRIIPVSD